MLSVVCGMIAIALFSVLFTGYVAWIPFVPDAWHASVAFVVAVLIAVPFIFVADTVLSFVLIVAAVLLIEGCLFLWRRAKSLFSRRKT